MAINPGNQYPTRIAPPTPQYPYGAARNVTVPKDGTGTPWEAALVNDIFGFFQAMLGEGGIVPSGTPENANTSQYLQSLNFTKGKVIADYAALQALDVSKVSNGTKIFVTDPLRGGHFVWDSSDLSTEVGADTESGVYVPPTSDLSGNSGAYVRWFQGNVILTWFGATGAGNPTDDTDAVKAAAAYCAANYFGLYVPTPAQYYYITSTVTLDNINVICESPNSAHGSTVGNFKTDQDILVFRVYCDYNQLQNIIVEFLQAAPTSNAIGFEFCDPVDANDNIRLAVFNTLIVRNAYIGFKSTSTGGTIAVMVMINCSSLNQIEWGFDFSATPGSTNLTMIQCFASGKSGESTRKGARFNNIKDITLIGMSIDNPLNEWLSVTNCDNLFIDHISFEFPAIDTNGARGISLVNCNADIRLIGMQSLQFNPGVGNDGTIVAAPVNAGWSCTVGRIHQIGTNIITGTLFKHEVGGGLDPGSYVINDNLVDISDIQYNGFDSRVVLNGKKSVPSFAFINGTHPQGDTVAIRAPVEAGPVASRYIIKEYIKVTSGASNVLNTDWYEGRVLTGN